VNSVLLDFMRKLSVALGKFRGALLCPRFQRLVRRCQLLLDSGAQRVFAALPLLLLEVCAGTPGEFLSQAERQPVEFVPLLAG
jgi:hypothetical protein